jgi:hypothetical protein
MFLVERLIDEDSLGETMQTMRTWLDHNHIEPMSFRCEFTAAGIVCRVEFRDEASAASFASAFAGLVVTAV